LGAGDLYKRLEMAFEPASAVRSFGSTTQKTPLFPIWKLKRLTDAMELMGRL
jgi:hypothetical protein